MCTVSFIPVNNGFVLTSNRDEHSNRGIALYPDFYMINERRLLFPRDKKQGGTWFICNEWGDTAVLLNGAMKKHQPGMQYRKSRGLVLIDLFKHRDIIEAIHAYDFNEIENFTLILAASGKLTEFNWDGKKLYSTQHSIQHPHIWSSVTLYNQHMIAERKQWFYNWIQQVGKTEQADVVDFHHNTEKQNKNYGLMIFRENLISTVSITSLKIENGEACMYYKDCVHNIEKRIDYTIGCKAEIINNQ
ncbi:MAG: NRDE family protein [Bacteroidetes bacterium]|nr:NRDE family protein [Bacteroidota bacterium]